MAAGALALATAFTAAPAPAHHVGTYTARDNELSQNFKQLKAALRARKTDVALRLFEDGAVRRTMRTDAARLPAGIETGTRAALRAGDVAGAEALIVALMAALARDMAVEAAAKARDAATSADARRATAGRFLEAIWRYWNLIDFAVSQRDPKTAVAIRLAFDEAEGLAKTTNAPAAANPCSGPRPAGRRGSADPATLAAPFTRIGEHLATVVETLSRSTRRAP
ncbi:MAG: hypothetical protein HYU41_11025 [Candidatus Rokubacteria bacterium]|nr:hypothetical protein [Candidatus Rokubacteria bacterium]